LINLDKSVEQPMKRMVFYLFASLLLNSCNSVQEGSPGSLVLVQDVEPQPLQAQVIRLVEALDFIGSPLHENDKELLLSLKNKIPDDSSARMIQTILDPYCLAMVEINPEARVKVIRGPAEARIVQAGWTSFIVKVHNAGNVHASLQADSPNALLPFSSRWLWSPTQGNFADTARQPRSAAETVSRFLELSFYKKPPLLPNLSGLSLEYMILQIYCKDAGKREAELGFNIGQGSQDLGFRNTIPVLFEARPAKKVILKIRDDSNPRGIASFLITDGIERISPDTMHRDQLPDERTWAQMEFGQPGRGRETYVRPKRLSGIYPLPSRRMASMDEFPDFFFQPQIYRFDGEHVYLPSGTFNIRYSRGPEYIEQNQTLVVDGSVDWLVANFTLKRWVDMAALGWYSADHHIHAAGCSHYDKPEEGVSPEVMWRQILGEDLHMASVLTWGPGWYHQKGNFTGQSSPLSTESHVMRYDVEVSGFPSQHAGHVILLNLKEDDYPGTSTTEQWPTWTYPVLKWAKEQGAVTGYAHSGWGLEPVEPVTGLPNFVLPKMDGIGANEYIVTVTQGLIDFYSAGDTPPLWELNMWYHTLNCGFRPRISGESDFPCIYDERIGMGRSYFKPSADLNFDQYTEAIRKGRSYVSDGGSHIINFKVNGLEPGLEESELKLSGPATLQIEADLAAYLPEQQDESGRAIAAKRMDEAPYWHIEKARKGNTHKVEAELIFNGKAVDKKEVTADGNWNKLAFQYPVSRSGWLAIRVLPSSHTNPVFVVVGDRPVQVRESAEWCRRAVDQCWKMKKDRIQPNERKMAGEIYQKAREQYERIASAADAK